MTDMLKKLSELANRLDRLGLYDEANQIDKKIRIFAGLEDDPFYDEPFEGSSKLTNRDVNNIIDRYLSTPLGGEDVEVSRPGRGVDPNDKVVLKFPTGPDVTLTGHEWDRIQVMLGIM